MAICWSGWQKLRMAERSWSMLGWMLATRNKAYSMLSVKERSGKGLGRNSSYQPDQADPNIVDAVGQRLIIETEGGDTFYFDVSASKFATSLTDPLPTRTPGPTLTPRATPTPISGDDVSNNPSGAGIFPLNTDLRYKISPSGDQDWFIFAVMNTHPLQVALKDQAASYQILVIYAEEPQVIGSAVGADTNDKIMLFEDVEPGYYYLKIEGINGSSNSHVPYTLRVSDYLLEWLPPLGENVVYTSTIGSIIPIEFSVQRFSGEIIIDETVQLSLLDSEGTLVMGPYGFAANPNDGISIDPSGVYSLNLIPDDLQPGSFTLLVTFGDIGGENKLDIYLKESLQPLVFIGGAETLNEGETLTRSGNFLDLDSTSWTGLVDYGLGDGFIPLPLNSDNTFTLSEVYLDDGLYTVTVQITDEQQATGEVSIELSVNNVSPSVTLAGDFILNEGDTFTGSGSFTDPGEDSWTAIVDYGIGDGPVTLLLTDQSFDLEQFYPEDGDYSITVCVEDDDGGENCAVLNLAVDNLPPLVDAGPDQTAETGQEVVFSGSYSDPGILDTHSITWDFGDGETAGGILDPTHTYHTPGNYAVTLTVTDDEGDSGSDSTLVEVTQPSSGDVIALLDRQTDNCLTLDLETGAYTWETENGIEYKGTADLNRRGNVVLFRSSPGDDQYLRGLLITRPEFGTARLRVGKWFRWDWQIIFDRDFTDPLVCP